MGASRYQQYRAEHYIILPCWLLFKIKAKTCWTKNQDSFDCKLLHSILNKSRDHVPPPRRVWSGSGVWITSQNLTRTSFSKDTCVIKFSWTSDHSVEI